jgi:ABC-2 type transport system ATP-binding protein
MIHIEKLRKLYGTFPAVDGISFDVAPGEILGFLGPNGAGKSTTMKVITGYYPPDEGIVEINGLSVVDHSLETRQLIGYLPESNPLYFELTVFEYLQHVAEMRQIPKNRRNNRIKEMADITGLSDRLGQSIGHLSKGYKQRVGLAQAMLHDPKILILDEPTIGLDPNQIVEIRSLIKRLGQEKTVILSTHILPEVQATCDRVVIINRGQLVADGTPDELQAKFQGQPVIYFDAKGEGVEEMANFDSIQGVESINRKASSEPDVVSYRIAAIPGSDPREQLFRLAVDKGWTLLGLNREIQSLEDIFQKLTQHDTAHQAAEEDAA